MFASHKVMDMLRGLILSPMRLARPVPGGISDQGLKKVGSDATLANRPGAV